MPQTAPADWTEDAIRSKLATSDTLVERALLKLHARQTSDEQHSHATLDANGVGFNAYDAPLLTSFAEQIRENKYGYPEGRRLSPKQREIARKRLRKYAAQLTAIAKAQPAPAAN